MAIIETSIRERGYPPSLRELADSMGIRSTNGVVDHVRALVRKGYLERDEKQARALRVVSDGGELLERLRLADARAELWERRAREAGWSEPLEAVG